LIIPDILGEKKCSAFIYIPDPTVLFESGRETGIKKLTPGDMLFAG
jgi:hypothetical protein